MFSTLLDLIARYGYGVVVLFVCAEGMGLPLPGESALVLAAAAAAQGRLSLAGVIVAGALGSVLGGSAGYWIGRVAGLAVLERQPRWLRLQPNRIQRARRFFERYGAATVFLARFVAFVRTLVCPLAGASGMPFGRFSLYNGLGGVLWAVAVGGVSFFLGRSLPRLQRGIGKAGLAVALLLALVVALVLAWRWFQAHSDAVAARAWRLWDRVAERYPRARAFIAAPFAPGAYLGLHLTAGLASSLIGLWAFGAVTEGVITPGGLTRFDGALASWLRAHATPAGDAGWAAVSALGSPAAIGLLTLGTGVWLGARRRWNELATWLAAVVGGSALNQALKLMIRRPRPPYAAGLSVLGFSFPSGHAMTSLICYGLVAYLVVLHSERRGVRIAAVAGATCLIAAIGFSRLYLGLHYFSDVVGGYAAGVMWLAACISGLEIARRRSRATRPA
ncbi:MAG TPA: bifunctional DedA family/phosphatase PAP2 family protein [Gemmatimonadales bacterium]|nr:bifunctional DedA family/phosphatase PAP2 family protein [Gemmatimonadales bacterium]